ncbi:MAG: glycoside hydrolase family 2 protein [Anaerolineae bacterium]|nr:glycoside hydrolase family 2 protein [Anaerolineae bacterium]
MKLTFSPQNARFREVGTEKWLPATIPGSVQTDLLALGLIPDPFVADNELAIQWVAERDWEYQLTFDLSDWSDSLGRFDRIDLVCDGLDTLAEVSFNGETLGKTDNMFRQYRWNVNGRVKPDDNTLTVIFRSTVAYIREKQALFPLKGPTQAIPGGSHVRKASCQFGWDWGPQLPPTGFWKDVRLEAFETARIEDVHLRQAHTDNGAVTISAVVKLERWTLHALDLMLRVTSPDGVEQRANVSVPGGAVEAEMALDVQNPQLWWPNGFGAQPLYDVEIAIFEGDVTRDQKTYQLGLRTLELRQEPDDFGASFTFVVNGVPIFAKGANWIPADSFPTRITDRELEYLIRSAADVHMNMLRVWGGGFYEEERFYDLCDQYGILIWQDFAFACSIYPPDEAFFANVRAEALDNVRRLRHRTSLALWCGNNEMEWGWDTWGWNEPQAAHLKAAYDRMYHQLLPALCAAEDPDTPYWPSSPSSGAPFSSPNGVQKGDTHNWEVWHGNQPFRHYRNHPSRFVSEFGFQSLPALDTVRTYAEEADWNMTSYIMEHHQRNDAGNGKIINYLTDHFRLPKDFPALVYLTQILQAECVRTGVEFWRRSRACTSGALYWQLNDCWPVASWASLDYYGRWKALHYAARRFYAPVLLSAEDCGPEVGPQPIKDQSDDGSRILSWTVAKPGGDVVEEGQITVSEEGLKSFFGAGHTPPETWAPRATLYVTNDQTEPWDGSVRWSLETLDGEVLTNGEETVTVPAVSAETVAVLDFSRQVTMKNRRQVVLVYELWQGDRRLSMGILPFVQSKHLDLVAPDLSTSVKRVDGKFEVTVTTENLARFVWLALEGTEAIFSDNFFDLPAGRSVTVTLPAAEGWTIERARSVLRVRSLVDSF